MGSGSGLPPDQGLSEYLLDNYGHCVQEENCFCIKTIWLGRKCIHWRPSGATNFVELRDVMSKQHNEG
jgi:hypothetical protein